MVGGPPDRGLYNGHLNVLQLPLPHMTLGEITQTEKAGMLISDPDRMTTLIQNAAMSETTLPQLQWAENRRADCMAA